MSHRRLLPDGEYEKLLALRVRLLRYLRWSADQAAAVELTSAQHQLLLAIRGHPDPRGPSVGDIADYLLTRHHSAGQLIARAEQLGLAIRTRDDSADRRVVRLALTAAGEEKLARLSSAHREELRQVESILDGVPEVPAAREA